ncbi:uncharacterized protein CANTADRAFT_4253 [Suhomyces tanzawaensis NRRL Y-17324]|uniref:Peptide:N-glycanase 1 n=1 Tax=Suhomyces tanzawaensis NRRL Y-17324 TaxID=984487 RepID=A0A1E4SRT7_9ASCO|nr:uncharacterized protein CANTADRAFT_4253 [Suhomyces tanzawaensis NRRL Y-17324]ODV82226.1 hypothetical protein CANTADRAFT_4253 [Suhomyces tanzawaensis NRRL Y-17324]
MSVHTDYANLANRLIAAYAHQCLAASRAQRSLRARSHHDKSFMQSLLRLSSVLLQYKSPQATDAVLDAIDLASVYAGVERRESSAGSDSSLQYDDFLVQELLHYFKHSFFRWVTKPQCPQCQASGDNIVGAGARPFSASHNPDQVSVVEMYHCTTCSLPVEFARINNPLSLLRTREGRCGEWVNCFLLILHAVIPQPNRLRYVWNHEDHVWCEYYSYGLQRWVHLDPCEACFDEPHLYANNWGKKMSFVIGFNDYYAIDLSDKYIPASAQIDKLSVVSSLKTVTSIVDHINLEKVREFFTSDETMRTLTAASASNNTIQANEELLLHLYNSIILPYNRERKLVVGSAKPSKTSTAAIGRQTGTSEWTRARGEDGS